MPTRDQKVFTTGQVAKICNVCPRTVTSWFDKGRLRGYRIPGSDDRRIPRAQLVRFLRENGMPLGALEGDGEYRVLLVGTDRATADRLRESVNGDEGFRFELAQSGFEAGTLALAWQPDAVLLDFAIGRAESVCIAHNLGLAERPPVVFGLAGEDDANGDGPGFAAVYRRPFDAALLAERLRRERDDKL